MALVLVVEDDEAIGSALQTQLHRHGHDVHWHRTGRAAVRDAIVSPADLVLLDLGLPDLDGVEVCRQIRAERPLSVVVILTARDEEMDVVLGLDAGADDYLTKPFGMSELLARVRAHLRRGAPAAALPPIITVGALDVDTAARRVTIGGTELALRGKEYELLTRLAVDAGTAVSRETLMADVWDHNWYGSTKTLDVHVAALRRKLGAVSDTEPPVISTLRGHGYRMDRPIADINGPPAAR